MSNYLSESTHFTNLLIITQLQRDKTTSSGSCENCRSNDSHKLLTHYFPKTYINKIETVISIHNKNTPQKLESKTNWPKIQHMVTAQLNIGRIGLLLLRWIKRNQSVLILLWQLIASNVCNNNMHSAIHWEESNTPALSCVKLHYA